MKILLIGGSGILGTELIKLDVKIVAPSHIECDLTDCSLSHTLLNNNFDIIINAAAIKDNRKIEQDPTQAIDVNIIGAARLAQLCFQNNIRYIYISTDYIYKGDRGNYKETDEILPFNLYSWTKLAGECSARAVKNHLIIRTSFGASKFEYKEAFTDKWVSKDYVEVIAPMIYQAALSPLTGVLNLGTERKTIFDYAKSKNPTVKPVKLFETYHATPYDNSFNLQKWLDYCSEKPIAKPHTKCRICGSEHLIKYLDLGLMPLTNNLETTSARARQSARYPLQILFCKGCALSQLSVVIDPEKMYSYYTYRSGVNAPYAKHCYLMCSEIQRKYLKDTGIFHIDIAGNDGTLLKQAINAYHSVGTGEYKVLNIDPASNLTAISEAQGVPTMNDFWNEATARNAEAKHGKADLITATNVFAHVDNVRTFLLCCRNILKGDGVLVIECPYIVDFIENMEFDTTYHEHLSYMSIIPIVNACVALGLNVLSVEKQSIHGGTIRVVIAKDSSIHPVEDSALKFMIEEDKKAFNTIDPYKKWAVDVQGTIKEFSNKVLQLKREGNKIVCFSASAKGVTLLNSCGINTDIIDYIVDETPEKIGKYSPGTGIPIVNISELTKNPPDYVIILSWNFSEVIIPKIQEHCQAKIIIPIPEFVIL